MADAPLTPEMLKKEFCSTWREYDVFCSEAVGLDGRCVICQAADLWSQSLLIGSRVEQEKDEAYLRGLTTHEAMRKGLAAKIDELRAQLLSTEQERDRLKAKLFSAFKAGDGLSRREHEHAYWVFPPTELLPPGVPEETDEALTAYLTSEDS